MPPQRRAAAAEIPMLLAGVAAGEATQQLTTGVAQLPLRSTLVDSKRPSQMLCGHTDN